MEGFKQKAAELRFYTFKSNQFLDWMWKATDEERKSVLPSYSVTWRWEFDGPDYLMCISSNGELVYDVGRNGSPAFRSLQNHQRKFEFIIDNPWMQKDDMSFSMLTRDALISILSHLHTANDLHPCLRVSKLFYSAATDRSLYDKKIQKLLTKAKLETPPFYDPLFKPHQYFFAMCFVSCKSDEDLVKKVLREMNTGNIVLIMYCINITSGWGHKRLDDDFIVERGDHETQIYNTKREDPFYVLNETELRSTDNSNTILYQGTGFNHPRWNKSYKFK